MRTEARESSHRAQIAALAPALAIAVGIACTPAAPPPAVPGRDAGDRPDAEAPWIRADSGIDAGPVPDAGPPDDAGPAPDGGAPARVPVIDGILAPGEWTGALERTAEVTPLPPYEGDRLTHVRAIRTPARLYLAITGTIEPSHALALYLDADFGSPSGVLFASGNELRDDVGTLDQALSAELYDGLSGQMRPEYAWGTTAMPIGLTGSTDLGGWREISSDPSNYAVLASGNSTVCSASVCETAIGLGVGGIAGAGRNLAIFLRALDAMGFLSNQTLPLETGGPEYVSQVFLIPDPATLDGGI